MSLKDQMAADAAIFFNTNEFGEQVLYNGVKITAIVDIGEGIRRSQTENRGITGYFEVKKADVPNPEVGDIIVADGVEWSFIEIASSDSISYVLKFIANGSAVILR